MNHEAFSPASIHTPMRSGEIIEPSPDCCAEWTRSGKSIDDLLIIAWTHGRQYDGAAFAFCPWCGRARAEAKLADSETANETPEENESKAEKCTNCGRTKGEHQAKTLACPIGSKHRTVGWTSYSLKKVYSPNTAQAATPA